MKMSKRTRTVALKLLVLFTVVSCASNRTVGPKPKQDVPSVSPIVEEVKPQTIRYTTPSNYTWLKDVVRIANCVNNDADYIYEISRLKSFFFTNDTGKEVSKNLVSDKVATLLTYKSAWRWSKTNAFNDNGVIKFNVRNNPRDMVNMVDTAIHERLHFWYSHNGNSNTKENRESVPYAVGALSRKYVKGCM